MRREIIAERSRMFQRSLLMYGVIESVDTTESTITAVFKNQFAANGNAGVLKIHVATDTVIMRQELVGVDGVYTGLSEQEVGSFENLQPGTHIAVTLRAHSDDSIIAQVILFGLPL